MFVFLFLSPNFGLFKYIGSITYEDSSPLTHCCKILRWFWYVIYCTLEHRSISEVVSNPLNVHPVSYPQVTDFPLWYHTIGKLICAGICSRLQDLNVQSSMTLVYISRFHWSMPCQHFCLLIIGAGVVYTFSKFSLHVF